MKCAWAMVTAMSAGVAVAASAAPPGTVLSKSGYGTIRRVPPSPTEDVEPRRPTYDGPVGFYAQEEGLTLAEAGKRLSEQWALQPVFQRLDERLRRLEPHNYVSARLVHQPDWSYTLYFRRDPDATLRKYHVNPRFKAAKAAYTEAELKALVDPWFKRFAGKTGVTYFPFPAEGRAEMMLSITASEYRAIAATNGWGEVPAAIRLSFAADYRFPRVDPRVEPLLRGFASESQATIMQMEMGLSGRVILDDGCLRLAGKGKAKGPLVVFHRETGIGLDDQGYLAAIDRRTGKAKGRVGEMWSWAGPNPGTEFDGLDELKAACGDGPIANVGNPESQARFEARYPGAR